MTFVPRGARRRFVSQENSRRLSEAKVVALMLATEL